MSSARYDFMRGKDEVNAYIKFLDIVENGNINLTNSTGVVAFTINTELSRTLKANAFLLLYNLIESTLRNGLFDVHDAIKSERVDYKDLESKFKKLLLDEQLRKKFEFGTRTESVTNIVYDIVDKIMSQPAFMYPDKRSTVKFIGGNLDIDHIHETFKLYGITAVSVRHTDQKEAFETTKRNRNNLAHGNETFNECGKKYSSPQLIGFRDEIFDYLERVLDEIERFTDNKKYMVV